MVGWLDYNWLNELLSGLTACKNVLPAYSYLSSGKANKSTEKCNLIPFIPSPTLFYCVNPKGCANRTVEDSLSLFSKKRMLQIERWNGGEWMNEKPPAILARFKATFFFSWGHTSSISDSMRYIKVVFLFYAFYIFWFYASYKGS